MVELGHVIKIIMIQLLIEVGSKDIFFIKIQVLSGFYNFNKAKLPPHFNFGDDIILFYGEIFC